MTNDCDNEKTLLEDACLQFPTNKYFAERLRWHNLPIFHTDPTQSQSKHRLPLHLPRIQEPCPTTLEQMCICTGGDSRYFPLMYQMIESLKATRFYKNVPINILDCGLSPEEVVALEPYLSGGKIILAEWPFPIEEMRLYNGNSKQYCTTSPKDYFKAVVNKPFLDIIFPGYKYYFYLNPNTWVQDENGMDTFVKYAETYGFGISSPSEKMKKLPVHKQYGLFDSMIQAIPSYAYTLKKKKFVCDAVFCAKESFLELWRKWLLHLFKGVYFYNLSEYAAMLAMDELNITKNVDIENFSYMYGMPSMDENQVLYLNNKPMRIIRPQNLFSHWIKADFAGNEVKCSSHYRVLPIQNRALNEKILGWLCTYMI